MGTWASCQIHKITRCACAGNAGTVPQNRESAIPKCIMARTWHTCRDACRDRWLADSFEAVGEENVPGVPGACTTHNFTYPLRDPRASLLVCCKKNSLVTGGCPHKRPVMYNYDIFFNVNLNQLYKTITLPMFSDAIVSPQQMKWYLERETCVTYLETVWYRQFRVHLTKTTVRYRQFRVQTSKALEHCADIPASFVIADSSGPFY